MTAGPTSVAVRPATTDDLTAIEALLRAQALPIDGVSEILHHDAAQFLVAIHGDTLVAAAALERHAGCALLRSVAVHDAWRGRGLGRRLVTQLLDSAPSHDVRDVYLLTTTAEAWFPRLGFSRVDRSAVPAALTGTVEFTSACPASAAVMHRHVGATA